jgi:uncharacterized protein YceK
MKRCLLLIPLVLTGCGTLFAHGLARGWAPGGKIPPYSGVKTDAEIFKTMPLVIVDFPLSAVADTLMLPFVDWHAGDK